MTYDMCFEYFHKTFQELLRRKQGVFVQLLLLQIIITVHRLHERIQELDRRIGQTVMFTLEGLHNLATDCLAEFRQLSECFEARFGGH